MPQVASSLDLLLPSGSLALKFCRDIAYALYLASLKLIFGSLLTGFTKSIYYIYIIALLLYAPTSVVKIVRSNDFAGTFLFQSYPGSVFDRIVVGL